MVLNWSPTKNTNVKTILGYVQAKFPKFLPYLRFCKPKLAQKFWFETSKFFRKNNYHQSFTSRFLVYQATVFLSTLHLEH